MVQYNHELLIDLQTAVLHKLKGYKTLVRILLIANTSTQPAFTCISPKFSGLTGVSLKCVPSVYSFFVNPRSFFGSGVEV